MVYDISMSPNIVCQHFGLPDGVANLARET